MPEVVEKPDEGCQCGGCDSAARSKPYTAAQVKAASQIIHTLMDEPVRMRGTAVIDLIVQALGAFASEDACVLFAVALSCHKGFNRIYRDLLETPGWKAIMEKYGQQILHGKYDLGKLKQVFDKEFVEN